MIIGLSGKSCSGKNYVGKLLTSKGFEVWDLDREAEKIRKQESDKVLSAFGTTDKAELSAIVFQNPSKLRELEDIIYPALKEKILSFKYDLVINGATLHRAGFDSFCSYVIYVDASYEKRLDRAIKRDHITEEAFQKREESQSDVDFRTSKYLCPVYLIDNEDFSEKLISEDLDRILSGRQQF